MCCIFNHDHDEAFCLIPTPQGLGLLKRGEKQPYIIDFTNKIITHRLQRTTLRNELLGKAMGVKPKDQPVIVDATAGFGRDSLILASLGFHLIALERSPAIHRLLQDALTRALAIPPLANIAARITLIHTDAIDWLKQHPPCDIIYLDPMFPTRKKTAAVKKEMLLLQQLTRAESTMINTDTEKTNEALLQTALTCATQRVVVKRPRLAAFLAKRPPHFSLTGRSSRFDIYLK